MFAMQQQAASRWQQMLSNSADANGAAGLRVGMHGAEEKKQTKRGAPGSKQQQSKQAGGGGESKGNKAKRRPLGAFGMGEFL